MKTKHTSGEIKITDYETPNEYNQPDLSEWQLTCGELNICVLWPIERPDLSFLDKRNTYRDEETNANAERLVKCWNMHDEMLEVLKFAKATFDMYQSVYGTEKCEAWNRINETIKKATS